jgi:hypothetical protein
VIIGIFQHVCIPLAAALRLRLENKIAREKRALWDASKIGRIGDFSRLVPARHAAA